MGSGAYFLKTCTNNGVSACCSCKCCSGCGIYPWETGATGVGEGGNSLSFPTCLCGDYVTPWQTNLFSFAECPNPLKGIQAEHTLQGATGATGPYCYRCYECDDAGETLVPNPTQYDEPVACQVHAADGATNAYEALNWGDVMDFPLDEDGRITGPPSSSGKYEYCSNGIVFSDYSSGGYPQDFVSSCTTACSNKTKCGELDICNGRACYRYSRGTPLLCELSLSKTCDLVADPSCTVCPKVDSPLFTCPPPLTDEEADAWHAIQTPPCEHSIYVKGVKCTKPLSQCISEAGENSVKIVTSQSYSTACGHSYTVCFGSWNISTNIEYYCNDQPTTDPCAICQDGLRICVPGVGCVCAGDELEACCGSMGQDACNGECVDECPTGYHRDPTSCECVCDIVDCGANAHQNMVNCACECDTGFIVCNNNCVIPCPDGVQYQFNYNSCQCECLSGYQACGDLANGGQCIPNCAVNQHMDVETCTCVDN